MTTPDFQLLKHPVLRASADGEVRRGDVVEPADDLGLITEGWTAIPPSGKHTTLAKCENRASRCIGKVGFDDMIRRARFRIADGGDAHRKGYLR